MWTPLQYNMYCTVNDDVKHMETHITFVSYSNCMITPMDIDNFQSEKQYCTVQYTVYVHTEIHLYSCFP